MFFSVDEFSTDGDRQNSAMNTKYRVLNIQAKPLPGAESQSPSEVSSPSARQEGQLQVDHLP
jgi:hypothetical protein